ncbi:Type IV secretory pathway, VirB6 component [Thiomonas arsenitoxydans]|uniref:Type IV secretory pathway, VirB6 component n=1 Tax=Thiomonas arsenitoxydans (strain DSM 22701 / CIP 110005 / 3As) TaxID=426114 RepID=D6CVV9_THIA3|nr:type IV secretion system protein [Thiomonas arsenitoxydans]CAZ90448.1 Type IV secretory pathway, VirB6 component [Thiomonas arsenitoxydans]CQR32606.1 Type IV secretory pathway, VirB6 component [Thiomonas arsenitoxydans]CQR45729.1 Type IV secretory pathway, VirB6 component [Thiomonas sp. CB3]
MATAVVTSPNYTFYSDFFTKIDSVLSGYVSSTSASIIGSFNGTATTLLAIYVALWGWMMIRGTINEPLRDGLQRIIKISLIWGFAMSVGTYQTQISSWVFNAPGDAAALISGGPSATPSSEMNFLDNAEDQVDMAYQKETIQAGKDSTLGVPDIGEEIFAFVILVVGSIMVLYGAFLYILSLVALAVLLAIGPIFIIALFFDASKPFFEKWIGMLFHYIFVVMLTAAVLGIILNVVNAYTTKANAAVMGSVNFTSTALPIVIISLVGALILMQVQTKAAALSGGVALATMGMFAATASFLKRGAMGTVMARRNAARFKADTRRLTRLAPGLYPERKLGAAARAVASKINPNTIKKV